MMSPLFVGTVVLQVAVFQLVATRLSRAMPDAFIGTRDLPAEIDTRIGRFRGELGRGRRITGALLMTAALLAAYVLPLDLRDRKLTLAVISLVSTGVLLGGLVRDARIVRGIAAELPDRTLRAASLERRGLHSFYSPGWEAVPAVILLATAVMTLMSGLDGLVAWIIPGAQFLVLAGLQALAVVRAGHLGCIATGARAYQADPEAGVRLDAKLRGLDARHGLVSRCGVAALFGLIQARLVSREVAPGAFPLVEAATWIVVAAMLVLFIAHLRAMSRARQEGNSSAEPRRATSR